MGQSGRDLLPSTSLIYDMRAHYLSVNPAENVWTDSPLDQLSYELAGGTLYIPVNYHYYEGTSGEYEEEFESAVNAGI